MNQLNKCTVCPRACELNLDQIGPCYNRINKDDKIVPHNYGMLSAIQLDKLKKKPFYHYKSDETYLSVGFGFCQMHCQWCQNFLISQKNDTTKLKYKSPDELVKIAVDKQAKGICFTYSEPTLQYEYIIEVASKLTDGMDVALKTNGFISSEVLSNLCQHVKAINVDLKGGEKEYDKIGGRVEPVLRAIEQVYRSGVHLEVSIVIMPELLTDWSWHADTVLFLCGLSSSIPVHLLYVYPCHQFSEKYPQEKLINLVRWYRTKMPRVYLSNLHGPDTAEFRTPIS